MKLTIIDYGAGNTANVKNAFEKIGINAKVSASASTWQGSDALVLPGVGAFGAAMDRLKGNAGTIRSLLEQGKPFLGICLGMQLLLEGSEENECIPGLCIFKGSAKRFKTRLPVPQMGWNLVEPRGECPLFRGMRRFYAYFVHSYYCETEDSEAVCATTTYGKRFPSAFWRKNVFATQFHPEKSGENGLRVLQNFIKEVKKCR